MHCERLVLGGDRLEKYISTFLSSTSLTSSIFTENYLDGINGGEGGRDSEWVGRLGGYHK